MRRFNRKEKVSIKTIKEISKITKIYLSFFEKNILWIGGCNSKGISKPRLPFNFASREGSRFIAAIINDGCITQEGDENYGRLMYDNFDETIRKSVLNDYVKVFGGSFKEVAFRNYERKKFLEFSSVVRDITSKIIVEKGWKCESNLKIPAFVLRNKDNMCGWVEQTIADEGEVKYYPSKYRRSIIWRRSLDVTSIFIHPIKMDIPLKRMSVKMQNNIQKKLCNLIESEKDILNRLGIKYRIYNLGVYSTVKNKIRTRWQISITGRENLIKLRKLIKIPSKEKNIKFYYICTEFKRYKEPIKIRQNIINLGIYKKRFTSVDLQKKMNYKNVGNTYKWLNKFVKEKLLKKIKNSTYGNGHYRKPAEYILIK